MCGGGGEEGEGVSSSTWELLWGQSFHKAGMSDCCPFSFGADPYLFLRSPDNLGLESVGPG